MVENIFFDIDDTLFPSSEFAELARRNALRAMIEQGAESDADSLNRRLMGIIRRKGSNYSRLFDELCRELKLERPARFVAAAVAAYHNTKGGILPYPEVPRILLKLRERGYRLYVATNGDAVKQWDKLIRMGIELYFEDVFVSGELGEEKSPGFFRRVVKSIDARPNGCLMVGDREDNDILPAKKAGMSTVRIRRGKYASGATRADFEVKDLRGLDKVLKALD